MLNEFERFIPNWHFSLYEKITIAMNAKKRMTSLFNFKFLVFNFELLAIFTRYRHSGESLFCEKPVGEIVFTF